MRAEGRAWGWRGEAFGGGGKEMRRMVEQGDSRVEGVPLGELNGGHG